jgi:hypothetical protein
MEQHALPASAPLVNIGQFSETDVADTVFYIQRGKVKLTVLSEQGKEAVVGILGSGPVLRRRMPQWPSIAHCHHNGDRRMCDYLNQKSDDCHPSCRAEIFR